MTETRGHDEEAAELVELYDAKWRVIALNADLARGNRLTGHNVDHALEAGLELERACAAFKRRHYPRRAGEVVVGLRVVFLRNKNGASVLFDPDDTVAPMSVA